MFSLYHAANIPSRTFRKVEDELRKVEDKLGFIGVLRQIPSESVGAIHESPASKLGFIELLRYGNPAKITYKPVGTGVLCQEQDCKQLCKRIVYTFYVQSLRFWKPNGA